VVTVTYIVNVTREGNEWLADVPGVAGAHTFARSLEGLERYAREVIALMDDLDDDAEVDVRFVFEVDDEVVREAARVGNERRELLAREEIIRAEVAEAVRSLTDAGYSTRDAAAMLGVTPGRVSQLAGC